MLGEIARSGLTAVVLIAALREAGVRVVAFRPLRFRHLWVVQNRSHIRGIVIDRSVGWTGGFGERRASCSAVASP